MIFMGHGIDKDGEEIPYVQLLDPSPPPRVESSFTKLRGHHVQKRLVLIAYGPPEATTWRFEPEGRWQVPDNVLQLNRIDKRYAHVYYMRNIPTYTGLIGVSIEAHNDFTLEDLDPENRKERENNGEPVDPYPFIMLVCRWANRIVTHEIRSAWSIMQIKTKVKQPLNQIHSLAKIQESRYSE